MLSKFSKFLSLLTIIALLVMGGASAAFAQDLTSAPGAGPGNALRPADGVVTIAPGQWQWYSFRSQAPVNVEDEGTDVVTNPEDATINAALRRQSGVVDFEVWSTADLNKWYGDSDFDPTGVGTTNEFLPGDPLFWEGSFDGNNNFYLIVKNRSAQTSSYTLAITGDVAFPSTVALTPGTDTAVAQATVPAASADMAVAQPALPAVSSEELALTVDVPSESAASEPAMMTTQVGFDAASAVMPANGTVRIAPGQWQWYTFSSQALTGPAGNEDVKQGVTSFETATIDAALRVRSGSVDFEVWSTDDLNNWSDNVDFDPTGVGTTNEFLSGDPLFWQGSFEGRNTFYLIVMNRGAQPATYSLDITGDVNFPSTSSLPVE